MNKSRIISLLSSILLLISCREDRPNQSALVVQDPDRFIITSIHQSQNEDIFCVGFISGSDTTIVKHFDPYLNPIDEINLIRDKGFRGRTSLKLDQEDNWIVVDAIHGQHESQMDVYRTDINFNVKAKKTLFTLPHVSTRYRGQVAGIHTFMNNEFALALDTSVVTHESLGFLHDDFGLKIMRFNSNLDVLYNHTIDNRGIDPLFQDKYNLVSVGLEDESVFYAFSTYKDQDEGTYRIVGLIDRRGKTTYQKQLSREFDWTRLNSLSSTRSHVIFNYTSNNELNLCFDLIDITSGEIEKQLVLPFNFNILSEFYGPEHFVNPLPESTSNKTGIVTEMVAEQQLRLLSIHSDLQYEDSFDIPMPKGFRINSTRQLFTDQGSIIVGTSIYLGNKENQKFILRELNSSGEIIR